MGPVIVSFEGEIGAGKSSLLEIVDRSLTALGCTTCSIPEPVDQWKENGILQTFYANPQEMAYTFQTYVYTTRVLTMKKAIEVCGTYSNRGQSLCERCSRTFATDTTPDFIITERSPLTDRYVFMETQKKHIPKQLIPLYEEGWETWMGLLPDHLNPNKTRCVWKCVYLKPTLAQCMSRIKDRGREAESDKVSLEYQVELRRAHERLFQGKEGGVKGVPFNPERDVCIVEGALADEDFRQTPSQEKVVKHILRFILGDSGRLDDLYPGST